MSGLTRFSVLPRSRMTRRLADVASGRATPDLVIRDFPAVTLPAALGVLLTLWAIRDARSTNLVLRESYR